jgi:uncharacterized membrane protein YqjE
VDGNEQVRAPEVRTERTDLVPPDDLSLAELFTRLSEDITTLVRQEAALARAEVAEKISQFGRGAAYTVAGGVVLYTGLLALIYAVIHALGVVIPVWAAALLVAVIVLVAGGIAVWRGVTNLAKSGSLPERTMESVAEDTELVREQVQRHRSRGP